MLAAGATQIQIDAFFSTLAKEDDFCDVMEENKQALLWFLDIDDLFVMKVTPTAIIYVGLDVTAIKHDAEMSNRQYCADDYKKLRELGRYAAAEVNKQ